MRKYLLLLGSILLVLGCGGRETPPGSGSSSVDPNPDPNAPPYTLDIIDFEAKGGGVLAFAIDTQTKERLVDAPSPEWLLVAQMAYGCNDAPRLGAEWSANLNANVRSSEQINGELPARAPANIEDVTLTIGYLHHVRSLWPVCAAVRKSGFRPFVFAPAEIKWMHDDATERSTLTVHVARDNVDAVALVFDGETLLRRVVVRFQ